MTLNKIIVYGPNGPEQHTRANARDLVNGAGYSWHPSVKSTPAAYAPFAGSVPPGGPPPSQQVLDSVGGTVASAATSAAQAAAAAMAEEQRRIQAALAEQYAATQAPTAPVVDFTAAPAVDSSDLDDEDAVVIEEDVAEVVVEEAEEIVEEAPAPAAKPALTEVPRGRGGRRTKA